jgi:hypothetical protein
MEGTPPILNIHSQKDPHDNCYIVGNWHGLVNLHKALNAYFEDKKEEREFFVSDGEGYTLHIIREDNVDRLALPYTSETSQERRDYARYPWGVK